MAPAPRPAPRRSVVAMGNNGRQSRFFTLNASCPEEELPAYNEVLQRAVASFRAPAAA